MSAIFLSYRRDDSSGYAGRLFDNLARRFDREQVFMDIETLEPGMDFVDGIDRAIESCGAVIAMIGPDWLRASDSEGRRRLDDPHDFIRLEIHAALKRDVRVIPVLVHNARMPAEDELPDVLRPLCRLQACEISDNRWEFDVRRLIDVLEPLVATPAPGAGSAPAGEPAGTQADTGPSRTSEPPREETRRSGRVGAVAVLVLGIALGAGWWFSRQDTVAPKGPILATETSPSPQDESESTSPNPPPEPAPTPPQEAKPEPPPIVEAEPSATGPAAARPVEPPPQPPSAEELARQEKARTIAELLARAEIDLGELRLSRPAGDNANERFRQVLALDPGNPDARRGLIAITERYHGLVEEALGRGAFDTARRHLESARAIDPNSDWLAPTQEEIQRLRRRAAASTPPAAPADRTRSDESRRETCLADCERRHAACREEVDPDAEANCLRQREPVCEQRYEDCMDDSSKAFLLGRAGLESECAGVHAQCERSAAKGCAKAPETAIALCDRRFERCQLSCRSTR